MMKRSMMQVFVKGSREALELYQKAFRAEILCKYPDEHGNYMHAELDAYGQVLAMHSCHSSITGSSRRNESRLQM